MPYFKYLSPGGVDGFWTLENDSNIALFNFLYFVILDLLIFELIILSGSFQSLSVIWHFYQNYFSLP